MISGKVVLIVLMLFQFVKYNEHNIANISVTQSNLTIVGFVQ